MPMLEKHGLTWEDVQRVLSKGAGLASEESGDGTRVDEAAVLSDYALDKLDPTQRVFADRVLAWGRELASAYKQCRS